MHCRCRVHSRVCIGVHEGPRGYPGSEYSTRISQKFLLIDIRASKMYYVKDRQRAKSKRIIRTNYRALYGPLMDQGWALLLWGSPLCSIGDIFVA